MRETRNSRLSHVFNKEGVTEIDGFENTRLKLPSASKSRCCAHGLGGANWEIEGPLSHLAPSETSSLGIWVRLWPT